MDKLGEWFGTPLAAAKTVAWLVWASFLLSLVVLALGGLAWVVQAVLG